MGKGTYTMEEEWIPDFSWSDPSCYATAAAGAWDEQKEQEYLMLNRGLPEPRWEPSGWEASPFQANVQTLSSPSA